MPYKNGEGGIRTLGTALTVQQISNLPLSTTQPPLQAVEFIIFRFSSGLPRFRVTHQSESVESIFDHSRLYCNVVHYRR